MKASLKLLYPKKIEKQILKAMLNHLKYKFKREANNLSDSIDMEVMFAIHNSPTVKSLESGPLREELGLINGASAMQQITRGIINSKNLSIQEPRIVGGKIMASIKLEAVPFDLSQFHDISAQVTEKGQQLPWFKWLTTLGDAIIVRDFQIQAGFPDKSRTGDKIMIEGKGWRVPPEHAGSETNNFITRAVDEIIPQIGKHVRSSFKHALLSQKI